MRTGRAKAGAAALTVAMTLGLCQSASAVGPGGWENLGGGLADSVQAVNTELPGQILVGGRDLNAGGNTSADHVAGWTGTAWVQYGPATALGSAAQQVNDIAVAGGKIYAGGNFKVANGASADALAVWDTAAPSPSWQPFCATSLSGSAVIDTLEVVGDDLYVGGAFDNANGNMFADNLVACDLATGTLTATVGDDGDLAGRVQALAEDSNGDLYVGGTFINVDIDDQPVSGQAADYIVRHVPGTTSWIAMPDSMGNAAFNTANVDSIATDGTTVYVGGDDTDIAGLPDADKVARWNGASWSAAGTSYFPSGAEINDLLFSGGVLYATGAWNDALGNQFGDGIASLTGATWQPIGSDGGSQGPLGPNGSGDGNALGVLNGTLLAGGAFTEAGGDALADRIACFGSCPLKPTVTIPQVPQVPQVTPVTMTPPTKCRKGQKLVKGKCLKKKKKKGKKK